MKKQETKICTLCNKKIYLKIDRYCRIQDYDKGKLFLEGYYHTKYYVDKIKENREGVDKVTKEAMILLTGMREKLGIEQNEVVRI